MGDQAFLMRFENGDAVHYSADAVFGALVRCGFDIHIVQDDESALELHAARHRVEWRVACREPRATRSRAAMLFIQFRGEMDATDATVLFEICLHNRLVLHMPVPAVIVSDDILATFPPDVGESVRVHDASELLFLLRHGPPKRTRRPDPG